MDAGADRVVLHAVRGWHHIRVVEVKTKHLRAVMEDIQGGGDGDDADGTIEDGDGLETSDFDDGSKLKNKRQWNK